MLWRTQIFSSELKNKDMAGPVADGGNGETDREEARTCLESYCLSPSTLAVRGGALGEEEGSWHVPTHQRCLASSTAPESLWASQIVPACADNERQRPTGESRSSCAGGSTCEKFVKGDERKGEEGEAGGHEHLARQPRQLPPRYGILSSGHPIRTISHSILSAPSWALHSGAWQGRKEVGGGGWVAAGFSESSLCRKRRWSLASL
ncbi:hypothetical protein TREES_T100002866 [Tupaia chinensis]|uniref:Uncharacterized protein n=1 Tax=Tupaia chinensis TaxID=246437 RepID=L9KZ52_TUPCH|nr:hypothetical protein TREES_T100002866 [Tupaia chinensis]